MEEYQGSPFVIFICLQIQVNIYLHDIDTPCAQMQPFYIAVSSISWYAIQSTARVKIEAKIRRRERTTKLWTYSCRRKNSGPSTLPHLHITTMAAEKKKKTETDRCHDEHIERRYPYPYPYLSHRPCFGSSASKYQENHQKRQINPRIRIPSLRPRRAETTPRISQEQAFGFTPCSHIPTIP